MPDLNRIGITRDMETPKGLTALQYGAHILEEILGWPAKGNMELMADCLKAISKSKNLPLDKAHGYMVRAIKLAKEQMIDVDQHFLRNGRYMTVRPVSEPIAKREKIDWEAVRAEQATPEWQEMSKQARELLAKIAGKTVMR